MLVHLPCLYVGAPSASPLPPQRSARLSAARRGVRRPLVARRTLACISGFHSRQTPRVRVRSALGVELRQLPVNIFTPE
jgi:hypothetical protein